MKKIVLSFMMAFGGYLYADYSIADSMMIKPNIAQTLNDWGEAEDTNLNYSSKKAENVNSQPQARRGV